MLIILGGWEPGEDGGRSGFEKVRIGSWRRVEQPEIVGSEIQTFCFIVGRCLTILEAVVLLDLKRVHHAG